MGAEIDFFNHDYQGDPDRPASSIGRPQSINKVIWDKTDQKEIKPDGILGITHNGEQRIFTLELHNATPTKRVIEQLYRNFRASTAIRAKFPQYEVHTDPYVLSVYTDRAILNAAKKRILATPVFEAVLKGLLFSHLDDLKKDFSTAWKYADDQPAALFLTDETSANGT